MATDRLIRETTPPIGRIASPVPQYKHYSTGEYEDAEGQNGHVFFGALTEKIVDLKSLLDAMGEIQASPTTNTLLERVKVIKTELDELQAQIGENTDVVVAAGAAGSLSAKLRRLTTDLAVLMGKDFATETTLAAVEVLQTSIDGTLAAIAALDFSTETTLAALKTNFDAEVRMSVYSNSAPGAHAGETIGMTHLNITNGNLYISTGAAWVLKLEGIWD